MSFIIQYLNKPITIMYDNLKNETVADLKEYVTKHFNINQKYVLMDLGRIMSDDEPLQVQTRNKFTIYLNKS